MPTVGVDGMFAFAAPVVPFQPYPQFESTVGAEVNEFVAQYAYVVLSCKAGSLSTTVHLVPVVVMIAVAEPEDNCFHEGEFKLNAGHFVLEEQVALYTCN